ncbi:sugar ABC transporter permease, partial [Sinorhizobium meliloti]
MSEYCRPLPKKRFPFMTGTWIWTRAWLLMLPLLVVMT